MGWAGLLAIVTAAVMFSERTPFPGFAALLPTVGTALAIAAGIGDRHSRLAVARLLALRPSVSSAIGPMPSTSGIGPC